jgi:hypothetical protein
VLVSRLRLQKLSTGQEVGGHVTSVPLRLSKLG